MPNRYLFWLAATVFSTAAMVGVFNLLLDPYGLFRVVTLPGFNVVKPHPDRSLNDLKMALVQQHHPNTLILGNSRSEIGFDPGSPILASRSLHAYNLSVPGGGIRQVARQLQLLEGHLQPKEIILGIDFLDFLIDPNEREIGEGAAVKLWSVNQLQIKFIALFSIQALLDSFQTLRLQYSLNPPSMTAKGFNPLLEYRGIAAREGYFAMFRQRAEENARRYARLPKALFVAGSNRSPDWDGMNVVLGFAARNKTHLTLVIYPYHAQLLLLLEAAGLSPLFEDWKRHMVQVVAQSDAGQAGNAELWDFSGFSEYQCERIPQPSDKHSQMQWYWEGGHFKKELGELMLRQILVGNEGNNASSGVQFGHRLTAMTVEHNRQRLQTERIVCLDENPELFKGVVELTRSVQGPAS